jgi:hypothetical protein
MIELKHKLKDKFKIEISRFHINRIITNNITFTAGTILNDKLKLNLSLLNSNFVRI